MLTIRTILMADVIYSLATFALYAVGLLGYRWWKRRSEAREPAIPEPLVNCFHCHECKRPLLPTLKENLGPVHVQCIVGGRLCSQCAGLSHHGHGL